MAFVSSFKNMPGFLLLAVLVGFGRIAQIVAIPVDEQQGNAIFQAQHYPTESYNMPSTLKSIPGSRLKYDWLDERGRKGGGPLLDEEALYMAALHCIGYLTAEEPDHVSPQRWDCWRQGYPKVKIAIKLTDAGAARSRESTVFALSNGITEMMRRDRFRKLRVKLYDYNALLGTFEFIQGTELASPDMGNGVLVDPSSGIQSDGSTLAILTDGSISGGNITIISGNTQLNNIDYNLHVQSTSETGLTLRAYTSAAICFFTSLADDGDSPRRIQIGDTVRYSPFQVPRKPNFDISVYAGYRDVVERRTAPYFTLRALTIALVELPPTILEEASRFDFFDCRLSAGETPTGNIWIKRGVPSQDVTTF